jgi:TetR/AcrR family transcriptional regulator, fatty acid metabolism regulator protein
MRGYKVERNESKNSKKKEKKDRRQQIVKAMLKCIADLGYNNVTMQTISSYSGLSKGAIHHYFKSKGEILQAAFAELDSKLYESVDVKLKTAKNTRDYLATRIEGPFELIKSDASLFTCLTEFLSIADGKEDYAKKMKTFFSKYRRLIRYGFEVGIKEGTYRPIALNEASSMLLALLLGIEIQLRVDHTVLDIEKTVKMIQEMFFGYLEKEEPPAKLKTVSQESA